MVPLDDPLPGIDVVKKENGETTLVRKQLQHINYLYRGPKLTKYSPLEYAVCTEVTHKKKEKDGIRGPTPRVSVDFDPDHPLAKTHTQRLRIPGATFPVPIIRERPPPAPKHDNPNTNSEKHRRFAEFYVYLLWP